MAKKKKSKTQTRAVRKPNRVAKKGPSRTMSAKKAMSVALSSRSSDADRMEAMTVAPLAVCDHDDHLHAMLEVLGNRQESIDVRLAALQALQTASFSTSKFESCRKEYIAMLRKVAKDSNLELRQRVFGILAREKDGYAQRKLLEGLKNPSKALLPTEVALQLLSYDVHADAYEIARDIVKKPPSDTAKREALRLLAADSKSAKMFEKILRDKKESTENRQISAAALHSIEPEKLYSQAKKVLLDKSEEDDDLQTTCLTALTQFAADDTGDDEKLLKRIEALKSTASRKVKKSARQFLKKYSK